MTRPRGPFTVRLGAPGASWHDSTHRRLRGAWERMLWLARSPRGRTVVEVYDVDGRRVSTP